MIKRFVSLQIGLMLFGLGLALIVRSNLGADPWTVFHVGAARHLGISLGNVIQITGAIFLLASWGILRQPIGVGSIFNMILVGPWSNLFLNIIPATSLWWLGFFELTLAIGILGLATALYISADMGAGPRDSFVLGLVSWSGLSIKYVRLGLELCALSLGYLLGGPIGFGTVIFALAIGPVMQFFLHKFGRKSVMEKVS